MTMAKYASMNDLCILRTAYFTEHKINLAVCQTDFYF